MTGETMEPNEPGEAILQERLDAYARARLSPSLAATARMRARVMREARVRLPAAAGAPVLDATPVARRSRWQPRRLMPLLLAAGLGLAVVAGAAAAGRPGGPLFDLRMWIETALLPTTPVARLDAELVALQTRIDEAVAAATTGNVNSLRDSLDAYEALVASTTAEVNAASDPDRLARLEAILEKHRLVLERVLADAPPQAQAAILHAIERSGHAIGVIESNDRTPPVGPGVNNGRGNGGPGTHNGQPTPKPTRSAKPSHVPPGHASDRPNGPASSD